MQGESLSRQLAANSAFADLSQAERAEISEILKPFQCHAGDVIYRQGDAADCAYILSDGQAELVTNVAGVNDPVRRIAGTGSAIGDAGLGGAPAYMDTASAVDDV